MQQVTKVNAEIKHKLWRTVRRFGEAFRPNIKQSIISKPNVTAGNKIKFQQQLYTSIKHTVSLNKFDTTILFDSYIAKYHHMLQSFLLSPWTEYVSLFYFTPSPGVMTSYMIKTVSFIVQTEVKYHYFAFLNLTIAFILVWKSRISQ